MSRITINDTSMDAIMKMVDGNPGAMSALMAIMKESETVDPDSMLGGIGIALILDDYGIYGSGIWILFKDICEHDPVKCLALLRADQLGQLAGVTRSKILDAIQKQKSDFDHAAILSAVQTRLPDFAKAKGETS